MSKPPRKKTRSSEPEINTLLAWVKPLREGTAYSTARSVASISLLLGVLGWLFVAGGAVNSILASEKTAPGDLAASALAILSILPVVLSYYIAIAIFDAADCLIEQRGKTPPLAP